MVMPRIFMVELLLPPAIGGSATIPAYNHPLAGFGRVLIIIDSKRHHVPEAGGVVRQEATLLARRTKLSKRFTSLSFKNTHHAGDAYTSLPIVVALVTPYRV